MPEIEFLELLRCPVTQSPLVERERKLVSTSGDNAYSINDHGIPLFAEQFCSPEGRIQQQHYDKVSKSYLNNLFYPHTIEYFKYLDRALLDVVPSGNLGTVAEICCGRGEAFLLVGDNVRFGIGVDVSEKMLETAREIHDQRNIRFVQGDATMLPLASDCFDNVFILGGIHHVPDRKRLFSEVARILKPGGRLFFRDPVSDFFPWRMLRAIIYRLSPALDHKTEKPLQYKDTIPVLEKSGLWPLHWSTHGFLGFCILMNSHILVFNRLFRFFPGIIRITRMATALDRWALSFSMTSRAGLIAVGVAEKRSP